MVRRLLNFRKFLLRMILPALRRLPLPMASQMVAGIGRVEYRMHPRFRHAIRAGVVAARQRLNADWDVASVSVELAGNHVWWRTRDLLLDGSSSGRVDRMFLVQGREHLDAALQGTRGAIILTSHFGGHLIPAHWLARQGYPLRFYMERPRHISKFLDRQFSAQGPASQDGLFISRKGDATSSAASILRAARALRSGMLLYLAGDVRWSGPNTQPATFLGRRHQFSATWINLAAMTSAPVVPVFCEMRPEGTYRVEFLPALHIPEDAVEEGRAEAWVQNFLNELEARVLRTPSNSNEYFFWTESDTEAA